MSQFDQEMWQDFVVEAEENLQELEPNLLQLEQDPGNRSLLNDCFRNMHSIKGSAAYMGFERISSLAHCMESFFDRVRQGTMELDAAAHGVAFEGVDRLRQLVQEVAECQCESSDVGDLLDRLNAAGQPVARSVPGIQKEGDIQRDDIESDAGDHNVRYEGQQAEGTSGPIAEDANEGPEDRKLLNIYENEMRSLWGRMEAVLKAHPVDNTAVLSVLKDIERAIYYVGLEPLVEELARVRTMIEEGTDSEDETSGNKDLVGGVRQALLSALEPMAGPLEGELHLSQRELAVRGPDAEEDGELYEIFLQFVGELSQPLAQVPDEPDEEWMTACQDAIQRLKCSAHYMDYNEVVNLLDEWGERLAENLSRTQEGVPFAADALRVLWQRLLQLLPGLKFDPDEAQGAAETPGSQEGPAEALEAALDRLFEEDDVWGLRHGGAESEVEAAAGDGEARKGAQGTSEDTGAKETARTQAVLPAGFQAQPQVATGNLYGRQAEAEAGDVTVVNDTAGATRPVAQTVRIDLDRVEKLLNEVGELVVLRAGLTQLADEMKALYRQWMDDQRLPSKEFRPYKALMVRTGEQTAALGRVVHRLQDSVMRMRMLPVSHLFNRYPRVVRDLAWKLKKKVELVTTGVKTSLDKRVIEHMVDPLLHIVRNAIDHGIEAPDLRERMGKPAAGCLRLAASQEGNSVVLRVSDDGRGLDREALIRRAVSLGLLGREEAQSLSDERVWDIIFLPGITTTTDVSETSGRGVGMDVVRRNVEKLGGTIHVESTAGQGTEFVLRIPLTLAIIQSLLVRVGKHVLAVPLASVQETMRIRAKEISTVDGFEIISLRQHTLPLIRLGCIFRGTAASENPEKLFVVVVRDGEIEAGLGVDALIGQQEVVIKPLVQYLTDQPGFSGATLLGDGSVALILDVPAVLDRAKSFTHRQQQILERDALSLGQEGALLH